MIFYVIVILWLFFNYYIKMKVLDACKSLQSITHIFL